MTRTLISLGANLGNARQIMRLAGEMIVDRFGRSHVTFSQLYRTPPVGGPSGQEDFFNAVATIESNLSAFQLWQSLCSIEQALGRQRRHRWEARRIDLDVLLHDQERHWTPTLKIPHPRMITRIFVLEPACEIAADWIEPVTGRTIQSLYASLMPLRVADRSSASMPPVHMVLLAEAIDKAHRLSMRGVAAYSLPTLSRPASAEEIDQVRQQLEERMIEWQTRDPIQLFVVAAASPDPTLVHWEDYARPWAEVLGLTAASSHPTTPNFRRVPKYLLPANDPDWAAHELNAAMTAMTCSIQPAGAFFDE